MGSCAFFFFADRQDFVAGIASCTIILMLEISYRILIFDCLSQSGQHLQYQYVTLE